MFQGGRLKSSYFNNVDTVEGLIKDTKKVEKDYEELMKTLTKLSEEHKMEIMVPFTKKAFIPGKLVHTGEVMVYLGDNWFVNRTVNQGIQIAKRRVAKLHEDLADYEKVLANLQNKVEFTETEGREQIVEELTEKDQERVKNRYKAHKPSPNVPKPRPAFSAEELATMGTCTEPPKPLKSILKHREKGSSESSASDNEEVDVITFRHSNNEVTSSHSHNVVTSSSPAPGSLHPGNIHLLLKRNLKLEKDHPVSYDITSDVTSSSTNQEHSKKDKFDINKAIIRERPLTMTNTNDPQNVINKRPVSKFRMSRDR